MYSGGLCLRSPIVQSAIAAQVLAYELYEVAAHFYERIAEDFEANKKDFDALSAFLGRARRDLEAAICIADGLITEIIDQQISPLRQPRRNGH